MKRRGSLILVLLMLTFFLLLTLAYLFRQPFEAGSANSVLLESRARALAQQGLEEVAYKLRKDLQFPQNQAEEQAVLSYTDIALDIDGNPVGRIRITLDATWSVYPYYCYRVTSEGLLGSEERPSAIATLAAVFDISPERRGSSGNNPDYWQWIEWNEIY